jgi:malate synthase
MSSAVRIGTLLVDQPLHNTLEEIIVGSGVSSQEFWRGLEETLVELAPKNAELLSHRRHLQRQLDEFHAGQPRDANMAAYQCETKKADDSFSLLIYQKFKF